MKKYKIIMKNGHEYIIKSSSTPTWIFDTALKRGHLQLGGYPSAFECASDDVEAVIFLGEDVP